MGPAAGGDSSPLQPAPTSPKRGPNSQRGSGLKETDGERCGQGRRGREGKTNLHPTTRPPESLRPARGRSALLPHAVHTARASAGQQASRLPQLQDTGLLGRNTQGSPEARGGTGAGTAGDPEACGACGGTSIRRGPAPAGTSPVLAATRRPRRLKPRTQLPPKTVTRPPKARNNAAIRQNSDGTGAGMITAFKITDM